MFNFFRRKYTIKRTRAIVWLRSANGGTLSNFDYMVGLTLFFDSNNKVKKYTIDTVNSTDFNDLGKHLKRAVKEALKKQFPDSQIFVLDDRIKYLEGLKI